MTTSPIVNEHVAGPPSLEFYQKWINGDQFLWPHDPSLTLAESNTFREYLKYSIQTEGSVRVAERVFYRVRKCTADQLTNLQKCLHAQKSHLNINSLASAISEMGLYGSLPKLRALFPSMTWEDFNNYLGIHESLSGNHMLLYATDILAWYDQEKTNDTQGTCQMGMLTSLQQCPLDVSTVVSIMRKVYGKGLVKLDLFQATENAVSIIYATTTENSQYKSQQLADQFTMLHKGWGIAYPVALLALMVQVHNRTFTIPEFSMLKYSGAHVDIQVAKVFSNMQASNGVKDTAAVKAARLVQSLYEKNEQFQFCIKGVGRLSQKEKNAHPEIEGSVFQDVGQP